MVKKMAAVAAAGGFAPNKEQAVTLSVIMLLQLIEGLLPTRAGCHTVSDHAVQLLEGLLAGPRTLPQ